MVIDEMEEFGGSVSREEQYDNTASLSALDSPFHESGLHPSRVRWIAPVYCGKPFLGKGILIETSWTHVAFTQVIRLVSRRVDLEVVDLVPRVEHSGRGSPGVVHFKTSSRVLGHGFG